MGKASEEKSLRGLATAGLLVLAAAIAGILVLATIIVVCSVCGGRAEMAIQARMTDEAGSILVTPSAQVVAIPSPNAPSLDIAAFYPIPVVMDPVVYANLDDYGPDEIIARVKIPGIAYYNDNIDVFGYMVDDGKWQRLLHYEALDNLSCVYDFGLLKLRNDHTRQLVISRGCRSGDLNLEIYQFRGLDVAELLYQSPEAIPNAGVEIANEQLYVSASTQGMLYHYYLENDLVQVETVSFSLPPNTKQIAYWRNGKNIVLSPESTYVNVGDLIRFVHADDKDTEDCAIRLFINGDFFEFTDYPNVIRAIKVGDSSVSVSCLYATEYSSFIVRLR